MALIDLMDWKTTQQTKKPIDERRLKSMNVRTDGDPSIPSKWAIRHKPTGNFMPQSKGMSGRGASFWDHEIGQAKDVRLFPTERSAKLALTAWLAGKHIPGWDEGSYVDYIKPVEKRKREEMEIIEMVLIPQIK